MVKDMHTYTYIHIYTLSYTYKSKDENTNNNTVYLTLSVYKNTLHMVHIFAITVSL